MFRNSKSRQRSLPVVAMLFLALAAMLAPAVAAAAPSTGVHSDAANKAVAWMVSQQQADGSFPGFGLGSTADAVYALVAARGESDQNASSAIGALETNAAGYAKSAGAAAKLALALAASGKGQGAAAFGGVDLTGVINSQYDAATGHYGADVTGHALAMLALKSLGLPVPAQAAAWLTAAQAPAGGWAFDGGQADDAADTNTTGLAIEALAAAGGDWSPSKAKALAYFHSQQNADAGFAFQKGPGNDSDADSTASVIVGLIAAGEDPEGAAWGSGGANPVQFLLSLQNNSGAFRYQASAPDDNAGATYPAVLALLGVALPVNGQVVVAQPGMPRTGGDAFAGLGLLLAAAAMLSLLGLLTRRAAQSKA